MFSFRDARMFAFARGRIRFFNDGGRMPVFPSTPGVVFFVVTVSSWLSSWLRRTRDMTRVVAERNRQDDRTSALENAPVRR